MLIRHFAKKFQPLVCTVVVMCAGSFSLLGAMPAMAGLPTCPTQDKAPQDKAPQDEDIDVDALMEEGQDFIADKEYGKAAANFRKVVTEESDNGLAWQLLGYSLHIDGKLDEAIEAHTKAATFEEVKGIGLYNLACAWSLKKDTERAFEFLAKSIEEGYDDASLMKTDPDLDSIRSDPRFDPLLQWCRTGKKPAPAGSTLVGSWAINSGMKAGTKIDMEAQPTEFKITDEQILIPVPGSDDGFVMSYKIDKSKTPLQIDMKIDEGPGAGGKAVGIISVDAGQMTLCYDPTGETRPEAFESSEANGFFLFKSKKVENKAEKKVEKKVEVKPAGLEIVGSWTITSGTRAGEELPEERIAAGIEISEDSIEIAAGEEAFVMGYKIDSATTPAAVDMKVLSGPAPEGSPAFGILKRDGDTLVLCYNAMGEDRPESFESTAENGFFLFKMKLKK